MELISIKDKLPTSKQIDRLSELYKAFSDSTRLGILTCLEISDLRVSDISSLLNMSLSAVSHQLRVLRNSHLVKATKNGKDVIYSLDDDHIEDILKCGMSHINE